MKSLLLTLDYELYGNGSGDVFKNIIEPTDKILSIANHYNAKITLFFEVIEYWKIREEWDKGNQMGYDKNPAEAMERQIVNAFNDGHDVQLHLHPQWINAQWTSGGWKVDPSLWRLGKFANENKDRLTNILKKGKETLESMINNPDYHCHTLRAGGYNIHPSENLASSMREAGLKIDTSIYPGGKENGKLSQYDYTMIPIDNGIWHCQESLENVSDAMSDLVEIPIVAFPVSRIKKYMSIDRIKSILRNTKSARDSFESKASTSNSGIFDKLKFFFQKEALTWDYCLFSNSMHRKFLKKIGKQSNRNVFVLVGHPKSFVSDKGLIYLLSHTDDYSKATISQYINNNMLK